MTWQTFKRKTIAEFDARCRRLAEMRGEPHKLATGDTRLTATAFDSTVTLDVETNHLHVEVFPVRIIYCSEWETCQDFKAAFECDHGELRYPQPIFSRIRTLVKKLRPDMVLEDLADV